MAPGIAEIVGFFVVAVGMGAIVAAAALVSIPLAVLAAGIFLVLAGTLVVYVANVSAKAGPAAKSSGAQ